MRLQGDDSLDRLAFALTEGMTAERMLRYKSSRGNFEGWHEEQGREMRALLGLRRSADVFSKGRDAAYRKAEDELKFLARSGVKAIYCDDAEYPRRLLECAYAPAVLFVLGELPAEEWHAVAVVGTRKATPYGVQTVGRMVEELGERIKALTVVSGLAYGIDAAAHKAAVGNKIHTVGVLAHGLDMIYPASHRDLAAAIVHSGGALVSRHPSGTKPYRQFFLERNQIIAGMSDLTFVAESEVKGGAMSTARGAFNNNREVFALPGRVTDPMSQGCLRLISDNMAHAYFTTDQMMKEMSWEADEGCTPVVETPSLFDEELDPEQMAILQAITDAGEELTTDRIFAATHIPIAKLTRMLIELELDGYLLKYAGGRYALGR